MAERIKIGVLTVSNDQMDWSTLQILERILNTFKYLGDRLTLQ